MEGKMSGGGVAVVFSEGSTTSAALHRWSQRNNDETAMMRRIVDEWAAGFADILLSLLLGSFNILRGVNW